VFLRLASFGVEMLLLMTQIHSVLKSLNEIPRIFTNMSKFFNWLKKDKPKTSPEVTPEAPENHVPEASENIENTESIENDDAKPLTTAGPETIDTAQDLVSNPPASANNQKQDKAESSISTEPAPEQQTKTDSLPTALPHEEPEPKREPTVQSSPKPKEKPSFFSKLKQSLAKTKVSIGSGIAGLFRGKAIDDDLFEELETQLLVADLGMNTTVKIIKQLTDSANRAQLKDGDALYDLLKQQMTTILKKVESPLSTQVEQGPFVILMVGVNGVGKTTTIGKMAKQFQQQGKNVMLAAGDTFRAAAVEQLQVWGERNNIPVVAQQTGSDSASVIFDAFQSAKAKGIDILIADTAGRLQNKDHLMEELKKVVRVMKKISPEAPHEIMLTLDASTGQNAVSQTKLFHEAVGLTGISLTKLDGTAKGGVIFAIADQFEIPIRYVGIGEGIDDLRPFDGQDFVDALFTENEE
jgi:fused signal recognition particle receptor